MKKLFRWLLVIVLGTGAGLALGVATNLHNDFLARIPWIRGRRHDVKMMRGLCLLIVFLAALVAWMSLHTAILQWSYVAMGLRGTAVFGGLLMGYGARLAFGCNICGMLAGIVSGSLHGWLWLVAGFAGTMLGVRLRIFLGVDPPVGSGH